MRRITLLAMLCILVTQFAQAKLAVATAGDGTVTLTLNAAGESVISYADYALGMVDLIESGAHVGERVSLVRA